MNKIVFLSFCVILGAAALVHAQQDQEEPEGFVFILGPRMGVSWTITSPEQFSSSVKSGLPFGTTGNYFPVNSVFAVTTEQRILLGETKSHFAFQEVLSIGGLEQSLFLPGLSLLIGYRDFTGFEIGAGPTLSLSGVGVVVAIGWTFNFKGVYVPIDINWVLPNPNSNSLGTVGMTTGFNFKFAREERKRTPVAPQ